MRRVYIIRGERVQRKQQQGGSEAGGGGSSSGTRYESQKRRDWNTFLEYLKNQKPPLTLGSCSGAHVIEFVKYLDQFGKTKVHISGCPYYGDPNPPAPCACPLKQAWGSLDSLIGRLRAAFDENGGSPESNPFGAHALCIYLREVRDSHAKARGISFEKKRKRTTTTTTTTTTTSSHVGGSSSSHQPATVPITAAATTTQSPETSSAAVTTTAAVTTSATTTQSPTSSSAAAGNEATNGFQDELVPSFYRDIEIRESRIQENQDKYNMTCSGASNIIESLVRKVERQDERINELKPKCCEKEAAYSSTSRLLVSLTNEINHKNEEIARLERKCCEKEAAYSSTSRLLASLTNEIDHKNEEIARLEQKCCEKEAAYSSTSRLLASLTNEIDHKNEEIARLERKCCENEAAYSCTSRLLASLTNEIDLVESRKMKATYAQNKTLKSNIQTVEKELEEVIQGLDGAKSGQEQRLAMNSPKSVGSLKSHIEALKNQLVDKADDIQYLQNLSETLIIKEHTVNNELVDARQELVTSLHTVVSNRALIGIKRMGDLNTKPFHDVCASKFRGEDSATKCAELCSLWEEILKDSLWHPFKQSIINGNLQEIIDESDKRLEELREEWGEEAYKAVTSALVELNEYNPSGRFPVPEIWNFREERKASLKEVIGYLIQQLKTHKRKRVR